ncbi:MAG: hypothetical protein KKH28_09625 [Elusimicrobia bacterium]|nr:hypothetical protein [Elusimicrobiota bacterium]
MFKRREGETLAKLSGFFGGPGSDSSGLVFNGNYAGIPFRIELHQGSKYSPRRMEVLYSRPFPFPLAVYKEHFLSRVGKSMGLIRDVQTWNPAFDAKFKISSPKENEQAVIDFFKRPDKKEAVLCVFALGFEVLKTTDGGLFAELPGYHIGHIAPEIVEHLLRNMENLYRND